MKSSKAIQPVTEESRYARALSAGWLLRLLDRNLEMSREFMACLSWSVRGLKPLLQQLLRDPLLASGPEGTKAAGELRDILIHPEESLHRRFSAMLEEYGELFDAPFRRIAADACTKASFAPRQPALFKNGERHLTTLFGLDEDAVKLCVFIFMLNAFGPVESYFSDGIGVDRFNGRRTLAHMLGMSPGRCRTGIGMLKRLGIIDADSYSLRLEDKIFDLWDETSTARAAKLFCRPLTGDSLPMSAFPLPADEVAHVLELMKPRKGKAAEKPVHVLLYGPPGTGKTTFARSLAAQLGLKAWSVPSQHDEEDSGRRASLNACINLASRHAGAFVLVDEAERLLDSSIHSGRRSHDKAWINELMEQPGCRIIWATNHVSHIEQAVRRRFSYSLQFEELALAERRDIWDQILRGQGMEKCLTNPDMQEVIKNYSPPVAVITEAVSQALLISGKRSTKAFAEAVGRIIRAHDTLRRDGFRKPRRIGTDRHFTLEGISLASTGKKSAFETLGTLLNRLKKADNILRSGQEIEGGGSLLFHGPPGTGKSALARYIADELNREYISKKASQLLSPYVGESEQNIAAAFREAEREGAVLLIDEADSFIFSRAGAVRSWESSMVNEFLTALEDFRGFCICTTNRRADMDKAAMRRFAFKVAFDYSGPEQILTLYKTLLAPLAVQENGNPAKSSVRNTGQPIVSENFGHNSTIQTEPDVEPSARQGSKSPAEFTGELPTAIVAELKQLRSLTPGDFHAVRARARFSQQGQLSHADLLAELKLELENKLDQANRRIGFDR
ncbi:ATP-binding protein [Desulfovibrio sp. OttesenSCG-928-C06]|nr:ATP-binding protein [Desulfovibrio sp. OttesenSCG-928-C06]